MCVIVCNLQVSSSDRGFHILHSYIAAITLSYIYIYCFMCAENIVVVVEVVVGKVVVNETTVFKKNKDS